MGNSWFKYTNEMEKKLSEYKRKNILTWTGLAERVWISKSTISIIRTSKRIGIGTLREIKEKLKIDLLNNN